MSMMGGRAAQGTGEVGQTVASFPTYEAAQKAVSRLIAADVPARDIAIVGSGLRSIERVTGRLGYAAAARTGAINGLLLGLLFSAILVLGSPSVPIQAFVGVLFVGVAIGMLLNIVAYSLVRRRRDFASVMQVLADHYEVTVTASSIHRARQVIGTSGPAPAPRAEPASPDAPPVARPDEPPRYGERVAPAEDAPAAAPGAVPQADDAPDTGDAGRP
ncbi:general stress protein [Microbacterium sp. NPDC019599]|uniref:general stress protein n=1 Tax=Microbacterium sp. NPDC019599 TaxID=3154690 RepID=UPI0033C309AD